MARTVQTNCPFTLTEYRELVRLAKRRFPLVGYADYRRHSSFAIWRHDVEYSVPEMSVLAGIDAEEGVRSTFFVQLHSEFYHFWEKETADHIHRWVAAGHHVGLHFDCGYHGDAVFGRIEELIDYEKTILERTFRAPVLSFSYHNPDQKSLAYRDDYCGLVNAYNADFFNGPITYVSDSNGRWRERTVRDVLEDPRVTKVQVNTHDTWWTQERIPQIAKLEAAILRDARRRIDGYRRNANVVVDDIL